MAPKYRYRQATIPDGHTWNSDEWHLKDSPGTSKSPCGTITNDTSAGKTYIASGATAPSPELRTCRHTIKESPRHLSRSTHAISTYLSIGQSQKFVRFKELRLARIAGTLNFISVSKFSFLSSFLGSTRNTALVVPLFFFDLPLCFFHLPPFFFPLRIFSLLCFSVTHLYSSHLVRQKNILQADIASRNSTTQT
ncbi:hypothetical protein SOVF_009400 [Spinacia oleracea]|nr:hypothetical protein SOVF_009400 [Spinacia oleracea]